MTRLVTIDGQQVARWPAQGTPAIETAYPPDLRHDHADLAVMARSMLDSRLKRFPELVAAGKLEAAEADTEIELFRQIADHWTWVVTGTGNPAPRQTILDRCAVLDRSLRTIAEIAGIRGGFDEELTHQAHCVIALRWHADPRREHLRVVDFTLHHQPRPPGTALKQPGAIGQTTGVAANVD